MIDFTSLNQADKKLMKMQKTIGFLDRMVKMVFYSTFILTIVIVCIAVILQWEQLLIMLVERWFTIMIGELVVTGVIQIFKLSIEGMKEIIIAKIEKEVN